jgi:HPt (histidine-containing phosphotransfer) domain-containing protein
MIVDPEILTRWHDRELMASLIEMFAEDAPRLAHEVVRSEAKARVRAAHTLRGSALNLGADDLATAAAAIERGDGAAIASLEALTAETISALRGFVSARPRSSQSARGSAP